MNFRQLEYIMTIYREGSMRKAAAKLYISQPALSQQLQKVEDELGAAIFDRTTTPMRPTYTGMHYLKTIERILFEQKQAMDWIHDLSEYKCGKVSFGISGIRSVQFLPLILPEFHRRYPGIEIELHEAPALALPDLIEKGEIDFSLMAASTDYETLAFFPLLRERVLLAVPPDSEADRICKKMMAHNRAIDIRLLNTQTFILLKHGYRLRRIADRIFEENHISPPVLTYSGNVELTHKLSGAGCGISFVGEIAAALDTLPARPNYYPLPYGDCAWTLGIACHPDKYVTKAMEAFFQVVREQLSSYPFAIRQDAQP
ncbi:MAG: LysR family transcriptional regulator [Eubacteriales bacterium]|nr:LysR family transcriptional regulator [Eubacteriales bacterium]